ncbi:MAG: TIGR00282 family metallophosphoesterase [Opitutales bacterium]
MPSFLFLGDLVGRPGRRLVIDYAQSIREKFAVDWLIVNGENAAGGSGITAKIAKELLAAGVDGITLGDHVWDQKNFENEIDDIEQLCRPANLPAHNPGRTHIVLEKSGFRLAVLTVLGRNYLQLRSSCPFEMVDRKLEELRSSCSAILVEAHMEATSEKVALGWHLAGRACAVLGTHTHIPTADERILEPGTAYWTDAGMCGAYQSVLGRSVEPVIASFIDGMKRRYPVAEADLRISGCRVHLDAKNGCATKIERIMLTESALLKLV